MAPFVTLEAFLRMVVTRGLAPAPMAQSLPEAVIINHENRGYGGVCGL
jgi:hypothetical protein